MFYSQDDNPLTTKTTVKKMAVNPLTSRGVTWKFEEELTLIEFYKVSNLFYLRFFCFFLKHLTA